jgi:hypothetical protein
VIPAGVSVVGIGARSHTRRAHVPDIRLIPGTVGPVHPRENLAAGCLALGEDALVRLDGLA